MKDDIIRMAREAGFTQGIEELTAEEFAVAGVWVQDTEITEMVERLVELARADEREACAELAFEMLVKVEGTDFDVPDAIRARGNT